MRGLLTNLLGPQAAQSGLFQDMDLGKVILFYVELFLLIILVPLLMKE